MPSSRALPRSSYAIFLEAGQHGKITLIHQLAAETLHVVGACLLLLIRTAMGKGAGRNRDSQQDERLKEFCAWCYYRQCRTGSGEPGGPERCSFHHHRMVVFGARWGVPQQQNQRNGGQ